MDQTLKEILEVVKDRPVVVIVNNYYGEVKPTPEDPGTWVPLNKIHELKAQTFGKPLDILPVPTNLAQATSLPPLTPPKPMEKLYQNGDWPITNNDGAIFVKKAYSLNSADFDKVAKQALRLGSKWNGKESGWFFNDQDEARQFAFAAGQVVPYSKQEILEKPIEEPSYCEDDGIPF